MIMTELLILIQAAALLDTIVALYEIDWVTMLGQLMTFQQQLS